MKPCHVTNPPKKEKKRKLAIVDLIKMIPSYKNISQFALAHIIDFLSINKKVSGVENMSKV